MKNLVLLLSGQSSSQHRLPPLPHKLPRSRAKIHDPVAHSRCPSVPPASLPAPSTPARAARHRPAQSHCHRNHCHRNHCHRSHCHQNFMLALGNVLCTTHGPVLTEYSSLKNKSFKNSSEADKNKYKVKIKITSGPEKKSGPI